jgi:23S rRNA-/tRNA-specific pseudouridylate synthase
LSIQFEGREAEKTYHAIIEGNPKWEEKTARHPLRANVGHKHRTMVDDRNGKPSETRFRVIKRYPARPEQGRGASALIEAKPMTGRTHQIRVHGGDIRRGNVLYGAQETYGIPSMLYAQALSFTPQMRVNSPLPIP